MSKSVIFSVFILLFVNSSFSQTEVEGTFFSDIYWTAAESPYHIVGDVQIGMGATLTIDPGVVVKYTGSYEFFVSGAINVNGLIGDSVYIESLDGEILDTPFFRFLNTDLSISNIQYAKLQNASHLILIDDECFGTLDLSHSTLKNGIVRNGDTVTGNEGNISAFDCNFENVSVICRQAGKIDLMSCELYESYVESRSFIEEGEISGISINASTVSNSVLVSNSINGLVDALSCHNSYIVDSELSSTFDNFLINNCKIKNSTFKNAASFDHYSYYTLNSCIILNTTVESNNTSPEIGWSTDLTTYNCVFVNDLSGAIDCYRLKFANSILIGDSVSVGVIMERGEILNSTVINNSIGIRVVEWGTNVNISATNLFRNINYNLELENVSEPIPANNNYWGSSDPNAIAESIYDIYDEVSLGLVDFSGFLEEPHFSCPISPPVELTANVTDQGFQLTWRSNPEPDVAGYRLHYGNFDGFEFENILDMGSDTTFLIPFYVATDTLAITAYDTNFNEASPVFNSMTSGRESWYSNMIITDYLTNMAEKKITYSEEVVIFPNPVRDVLYLEFSGADDGVMNFNIFDFKGVLVQKGGWTNSDQFNVDVSNLKKGSYFIKVKFEKHSVITKFIKL